MTRAPLRLFFACSLSLGGAPGCAASSQNPTADLAVTLDASVPADAAKPAPVHDLAVAMMCPPLELSGGLLPLVTSIVDAMKAKAGPGSNAMVVPTPNDIDAFSHAAIFALAGRFDAACALPPSYRLVHLRDPKAGGLYVVAEVDDKGQPAPVKFWGTFVALEDIKEAPSRPLLVEAPHPLFDTNTWREATELFIAARARGLLIAGAHRCANDQSSGCDGTTTACGAAPGPFHVSDAAHSVAAPFYAVHIGYTQIDQDWITLQLHGNAQPCPTALLSDGSGSWSDDGPTGLLAAAFTKSGIDVGKCGSGFPTQSCDLCGTDNVEIRATADSPLACTQKGTSYGRVVHLEQQMSLRETPAPGVPGYQPLIDLIVASLPPST